MRRSIVFGLLLALALGAIAQAAPKKKEKGGDLAWVNTEFASFGVDRIAMIPAVTYNNELVVEKQVEGIVAMSLHESSYRWISAGTVREMLRSFAPNDSLLKAVRQSVLQNARVDSASAPRLCARLRCSALLTMRVDQWEKQEIDWDQSGKPSTSVQLKAALVDSTGALLWTAASSETKEGPYHDANATPIGMSGGSLQQKPVTGQGGAPAFDEVVTGVAKRWATFFPTKPSAAPADSAAAVPNK
jgi:hypothetical protein